MKQSALYPIFRLTVQFIWFLDLLAHSEPAFQYMVIKIVHSFIDFFCFHSDLNDNFFFISTSHK